MKITDLKKGSEIKIRKDLRVGETYGSLATGKVILNYLGKTVIVDEIDKEEGLFSIRKSGNRRWFSLEMIDREGVE